MDDKILQLVEFLKKGNKIHIKESQKGSFTKYCNGNVTEECIRRGKNSPDPRIRKKATFAANARKWKHQNGGRVYSTIEEPEVDYKSGDRGLQNEWDWKAIATNPNKLRYSINYLRDNGFSNEKIAAILGNAVVESGLDVNAHELKGGPGRGLFQWTTDLRKKNLDAYRPDEDLPEIGRQLSFMINEMGDSNIFYRGRHGKRAWDNAKSLADSVTAFERYYENPATIGGEHSRRRLNAAQYIYNNIDRLSAPKEKSTPLPHPIIPMNIYKPELLWKNLN